MRDALVAERGKRRVRFEARDCLEEGRWRWRGILWVGLGWFGVGGERRGREREGGIYCVWERGAW